LSSGWKKSEGVMNQAEAYAAARAVIQRQGQELTKVIMDAATVKTQTVKFFPLDPLKGMPGDPFGGTPFPGTKKAEEMQYVYYIKPSEFTKLEGEINQILKEIDAVVQTMGNPSTKTYLQYFPIMSPDTLKDVIPVINQSALVKSIPSLVNKFDIDTLNKVIPHITTDTMTKVMPTLDQVSLQKVVSLVDQVQLTNIIQSLSSVQIVSLISKLTPAQIQELIPDIIPYLEPTSTPLPLPVRKKLEEARRDKGDKLSSFKVIFYSYLSSEEKKVKARTFREAYSVAHNIRKSKHPLQNVRIEKLT